MRSASTRRRLDVVVRLRSLVPFDSARRASWSGSASTRSTVAFSVASMLLGAGKVVVDTIVVTGCYCATMFSDSPDDPVVVKPFDARLVVCGERYVIGQ